MGEAFLVRDTSIAGLLCGNATIRVPYEVSSGRTSGSSAATQVSPILSKIHIDSMVVEGNTTNYVVSFSPDSFSLDKGGFTSCTASTSMCSHSNDVSISFSSTGLISATVNSGAWGGSNEWNVQVNGTLVISISYAQ